MSYFFMSNIKSTSTFNSPDNYFQNVGVFSSSSTAETPSNGVIIFNDEGIQRKAKFLMIRAGNNNDFVIQLSPSNYCVYIPAGELWSVDSVDEVDKFYIRNIFSGNTKVSTGKLQWMIGYK